MKTSFPCVCLLLCTMLAAPGRAQWLATSGPAGPQVWALGVDALGNLTAGTTDRVYRSSNDGTTWTPVHGGMAYLTSVRGFSFIGHQVFAGTRSGVFRTVDTDTVWTAMNSGLNNLAVNAILAYGDTLLVGTTSGIYRSTNLGMSWTLSSTGLVGYQIWALAANGGKIYAGSNSGAALSLDGGRSWTAISSGMPVGSTVGFVFSGGKIFAGLNPGGVYVSTDAGSSWNAVNTGIDDQLRIGAVTAVGSSLIASTLLHVYASSNSGASWTASDDGLAFNSVLSFAQKGGTLFAGAATKVWKRPVGELTSAAAWSREGQLPRQTMLWQNYPNPFNPATTFCYALAAPGFVRLRVFDVLGRLTAQPIEGVQAAGQYTVRWDAAGLASGVYLYELEAPGFRQARTLVISR